MLAPRFYLNGNFIAHLQSPICIIKVITVVDNVTVRMYKVISDNAPEEELKVVLTDALAWYMANNQLPEDQKYLPSGMSLKDAFYAMISTRNIKVQLDRKYRTIRNYRDMMKEGKTPSNETMRDYLSRAGWMIMQEEKWAKMNLTGDVLHKERGRRPKK
jgi:hypothetical protein